MSPYLMGTSRSRSVSSVGLPGVVLVLTVLLVGLFLVMGISLINLASSDYQIANNESRSVQALFNADAGTEEAKMRVSPATVPPNAAAGINIPYNAAANWRAYIYSGSIASPTTAEMQSAIQGLDPTYGKKVWDTSQSEDTTNYTFYNTVQGSNKIQWGWARIQHKFNGASDQILYLDVVNGGNTASTTSTNASGVEFNNLPIMVVTSEGVQGSVRRMIQMEIVPQPDSTVVNPFGNGAFGANSVTLNGGPTTDSYNSAAGPYGGSNVGSQGDIVTNATGSGVIYVGPGGTVNGSARIGTGGAVGTGISNSGTITGSQLANASVTSPTITIPSTGVIDKGAVSLTQSNLPKTPDPSNPCQGASLTLPEGTYRMSSLSISGQGMLCVTGKVVIYVDGNIDAGGNGIVNASGVPTNLLIYGTSNCTDVKIHGNGNFYGGVYTPSATATITGSPSSQLFGAITANTVVLNGNGTFHYDTALANVGAWSNTTILGYSRYSWREIPF